MTMSESTEKKDHVAGHVAVRLDAEILARLEALRPRMSKELHNATPSDVLRSVILAGLALKERETETPPLAKV
jgi:uncharacterized membrane protein